jgi:ferrochelatase
MLDAAGDPAMFRPMKAQKVAIVLFNLGGPDRPEAIKPFLVNLFRDPAILRVPGFIRPLLARVIARARLKPATENYALLGGRSPLLGLTEKQARALEAALPDMEARCVIAMRYWHPFSEAAVREVQAFDPDHVVLLPLYPQFSTTTTGSSLSAWRNAAARLGLVKPTTAVCCYHSDSRFVAATAALVQAAIAEARAKLPDGAALRVLFSAHGLPEVIVRSGDPYQYQVERTVSGVVSRLAQPDLDWRVCYQSRATPQRWIGPSTDDTIREAGQESVAVLVVPIAFVSEHSETLIELDIEYRELAEREGVPAYFRCPTQNADAGFIEALAGLVRGALARGPGLCSFAGGRTCPRPHADCPHARAGAPPLPAEPSASVELPELLPA